MARTFPDRPAGSLKPEVARVFRALKRLPDDWNVWYHVTPWQLDAPHFLVLDDRERALLLQVSDATPRQAQQAPQMQLAGLEVERAAPGEAEEQRLSAFLDQVSQQGVPIGDIAAAVIFPNLPSKDLRAVQHVVAPPRFQWLANDWIDEQKSGAWDRLFVQQSLNDKSLHILRERFAPEAVIPPAFVARVRRRQNVAAAMGAYLLDYDQEHILKTDLDLDAAGELLARDFRIQVVNGVTGSGKTLILLYRLRLLHALFPSKSFLVLTHNRPLIRDMQARFSRLQGGDSQRIHWFTFLGWCRKHWPENQPYKPISQQKRDTLIREVRAEYLTDGNVTEGMLKSELGWVKDSGISKREDYLYTDRRGRGFRLTQGQRERMFAAISAYQRRLTVDTEAMDWWDVPRRMWRWIEEGQVVPPRYDVVMVDEAQFFAPVWFDIVRHLVQPRSGYLFVAADPTQGFLRRGESWKAITGLDVRGTTHQLRRSYRTTQAILGCALAFYRQRLPDDDEELLLPELEGMPQGKPPRLLRFDSPQDERARLVNEIAQAIEGGVPPRHCLVLCAAGQGVDALQEALNQRLGPGKAMDPKDVPPGDFVRVTTINAGTGLESAIVFVTGMHQMFEQEDSLRLSEDERAERIRENTRKLYMAFTRAGQRLVLTYVGELPAALKGLEEKGLLEMD